MMLVRLVISITCLNIMMLYFHKISNISGGAVVQDRTYVILGDSISKGTSNGVGDANSDVLYEFNGTSFDVVINDVAAANTGSWMPSFANRLNEFLGCNVNLSTNGSAGSEFSPYLDNNNWSISGTLYSPMKVEADALALLKNINGFIIILGINDARGTASISQIETDAISLIDRLNSDFSNPKIYIVQIGRTESGVTQRVLDVRDIISNGVDGLVETYSNVKLCASLADFDNSYFYDNLHLTQTGNDILGEQIANYIINDIN